MAARIEDLGYVFKVDFAKAYDSIRWDYLDDALNAFGFGSRWLSWIQGSLNSGKASVLVNESPTSEFQFHRGLKQGNPLAPFLFILIMESLHLSFNSAVEAGIFTGLRIDDALTISHLFYADDAIFIGEWSKENLKGILNILNCFSLLSGMSINLKKSHILGLGIRGSIVSEAAASLGCSVMKTPFNYLGIMVGGNMSLVKSWDETVHKLTKRLSKWKLKTLSIGGRLTLLKSVLGSTPIYNMSIFKVPKTVLNKMENLRRNFFNGIQEGDRKITWVKWHTVLAAKKFGGLGVSSFFALNRGLLAKWVWRFLSQDNSLWCQLISAIHGSNITDLSTAYPSTWNSIIKEFNYLKVQGVDVFSHCKIRIGNGLHTRFWKDLWIGDCTLSGLFPRLFALDTEKDISVAGKLQSPLVSSFRRNVRGGIEEQQLEHLVALLDSVILSNSNDRWVSDLNGDGVFRVKDVRNLLDEFFLPRADIPTRWVKNIPIKVNIFAWKLALDRLPTRANLVQRNVVTESQSCPLCDAILEDTSHLFFNCSLARDVTRLLCRWWNLGVQSFSSYAEWLVWFNSVRLASNLKVILEGVFYVTWWSLWNFRNQLLFASKKPRKESIFDDIVLRSFCWCKARGSFNKFTWFKNKALYTRIAAYSDQTRPNPTFVSTSWRHSWDHTLGTTLIRMSAMANATPIVTTVTKTTNKEKASDVAPRVNIQDFCEEHYEDIMPIIMEKARRDKRKERTKTKYRDRPRNIKRWRESESPSSHGSESDTSNGGHWKSRTKRCKLADEDDLVEPWTCEDVDSFTLRICNFKSSRKTRMPNNVKTYDGTGDPKDHLKIFQATTQVERWAMPTWCHMFNSTLIGAARVSLDELPLESIDGYKGLKAAFLAYFMQQKKYVKDPVEIHNIKQMNGETIEDFMERFKVETGRMKGAPECMWISGFMHGVNNPELTKRLNKHVLKTMEEMMTITNAFIREEAAAAS
ncbi:RNA-directed DNA polymerase, eukaryota [Tanacetum coccineum]|uniref:RNA-directed DNA polymerase, eukaryota n=1 Tax=Tanacetum coccineum TaxID=301880 RepID=A0ABQ5ENK8_9ASTR